MHAVWLAVLAAAEGAEGPASPFEVNLGLFVWTWLVFIVLFLVLKKFAWPAIVAATEERERKIQQQLAEAERLHAEARTALDEGKRFAVESRNSAHALLAEARSTADKERAALLDRAKGEQEDLLARARREIASEKEKALTEIRKEAVDLSLAAAAKLVGQRFDAEADRRLVREYLDSVELSS